MKKVIVLLFFIICSNLVCNAQEETCSSKEYLIEDFNSIEKCHTKKTDKETLKNKKQLSQTKNIRFLRKRRTFKHKITTTGIVLIPNEIKSLALNNFKNEVLIVSKLLKNEIATKEISFNLVQQIPQFLNCSANNTNNCFNLEMSKHIKKHFTYPKKAIKNNLEGELLIEFVIDKKGFVKTIQVTGPENTEILKEEAKRLIKKLPQFIPGKHNGNTIDVRYAMPMSFTL